MRVIHDNSRLLTVYEETDAGAECLVDQQLALLVRGVRVDVHPRHLPQVTVILHVGRTCDDPAPYGGNNPLLFFIFWKYNIYYAYA